MSTTTIPHTKSIGHAASVNAYGSRLALALEVLEVYRNGTPALTVEEIAQRVDGSPVNVRKAVEKLRSLGYLETLIESQTYWPTTRLDWITDSMERPIVGDVRRLPPPADPRVLAKLFADHANAVVEVAVRNGIFMQHIAYWAAKSCAAPSPGSRKICVAPVGLAWLWAESDATRENLMQQSVPHMSAAQLATMYDAFAQFDDLGYCLLQTEDTTLALAAPVRRDGQLVGAISCAASNEAKVRGEVLRSAAQTVADSMFPQK